MVHEVLSAATTYAMNVPHLQVPEVHLQVPEVPDAEVPELHLQVPELQL